MKQVISAILGLIIIATYANALQITEIMYNPEGSDENHEWIEIYNNESQSINLTNYKFFESGTNHNLNIIQGNITLNQNNYAIITKDDTTFLHDFPTYNQTLLDSSFTLSNEEEIEIRNSTLNTIDKINYTSEWGAENNNLSLQLINKTWQESIPTPGYENIKNNTITKNTKIIIILKNTSYLNFTYTNLFKITNNNKNKIYNTTLTYKINNLTRQILKEEINSYTKSNTGFFNPQEEKIYKICLINITYKHNNTIIEENHTVCKNITIIDPKKTNCDLIINITTDKNIYNNKEQIKFKNNINNKTFYFEITYWIENIFNETEKERYTTTNTNQKTYTPIIEEKDKAIIIKAIITKTGCNDTNQDNNYAEKIIVIKNNLTNIKYNLNTSINITKLSKNITEFGKTITIELDIIKGNETKNQIKAYIENENKKRITEYVTTLSIYERNQKYKLKVPLHLIPNCNYKFKNKSYTIVVEGLNKIARKNIKVEGNSNCEKLSYKPTTNKKLTFQLIDFLTRLKKNQLLILNTEIINPNDEEEEIQTKYKIYKGKTTHIESNYEDQLINAKSTKLIREKINLANFEPGQYKLKISVKKKSNKNPYIEIYPLEIIGSKQNMLTNKSKTLTEKLSAQTELESNNLPITLKNEEKVIYLSKQKKSKKLVPYMLFIANLTFIVSLLRKN